MRIKDCNDTNGDEEVKANQSSQRWRCSLGKRLRHGKPLRSVRHVFAYAN